MFLLKTVTFLDLIIIGIVLFMIYNLIQWLYWR